MEKYEIYDNLINNDDNLYDIMVIETNIMVLENKLFYGLDSEKMQILVDLKKEYEKLIKEKQLEAIDYTLKVKM